MIALADQLYWRFDLLTLIAAALAAEVVTSASQMLAQSTESLAYSGWRTLAGLMVTLGAAAFVARSGSSSRRPDALPEDELQLASSPAASPAHLQAERERLMAEFGVAREAQQKMLPAAAPSIPGYSITATCRPAREVGGDLFDFLTLPDERIGIVVADVSGKGVPAALYMTLTKGLLASISESESDPSIILREVNKHLYEVCQRKVFVTMLLGVLDPATRTLTYARAGHNPAIWRHTSQGASTMLGAPGLGLGMVSSKLFDKGLRSETIQCEPGDVLVFYSDGIPEAMNLTGEEYGMERLMDVVERSDELGPAEALDCMLADVADFVGENSPHDDITLVVLRVAER